MSNANVKSMKADKDTIKKGGGSKFPFYRPPIGFSCLLVCPGHENMKGVSYQKRGKHRNCGPEAKTDFTCRREDKNSPLKECPQCERVNQLYSTKDERDKAVAGKERRNQRYYFQTIPVNCMVNSKNGRPLEMAPIPECFLMCAIEDTEYKKCKNCDWYEACDNGIQGWSVGVRLFEDIVDAFDDTDDVDYTQPETARPVIFKRSGEGFDTEYKGYRLLEHLELPEPVVKRIKENVFDLTTMSVPKTYEEVQGLMAGIRTSEYNDKDKTIEDNQNPDCFGQYDPDDASCKSCEFADQCKETTKDGSIYEPEGKDDEDEVEAALRKRAARMKPK